VSESQLGRITAGTEQVVRSDAVTIPPPPRPSTLSSDRRLPSDAEPAERHAERRKRNPTSSRLCGARQPANPPTPSLRPLIGARSGPLGIPRVAPTGAQRRRPEGCRATVVSHFRAGPGALRRAKRGGDEERYREGLEAEPEQPALLAEPLSRDCRHWRNCDTFLARVPAQDCGPAKPSRPWKGTVRTPSPCPRGGDHERPT
jgi:hypothetical protein